MSGEIEKEPVLQSEEKTIEMGKEIYLKLREEGLNLIEPRRAAKDSLNPEASRTLRDLLDESTRRLKNLDRTILKNGGPLEVWQEAKGIVLTWRGFMIGARESGDDEIAEFIKDKFLKKYLPLEI